MILFDLKCAEAHVFEAWFPSSAAFERQRKKGQVICPVCGGGTVEKALMAPNIASSRDRQAAREEKAARESVAAKTAMRRLAELRRQIEANCDYVGPKFAEEALKIHYGEAEKRDIYGEASPAEAESLREEGVEFASVPWPQAPEN